MPFKYAKVEVIDDGELDGLTREYAKLTKMFEENENHGHTIVCQIFAHVDNPKRFFLTGRILNPEESKAFAAILAKAKS